MSSEAMSFEPDCERNRDAASAYVDGELAAVDAAAFERHMAACARCTAEVAGLMRMKRELRAAKGQFVAQADFRSQIRRQIAVPETESRWRWWMPVGAAAVLLLAISFGAMQFWPRSSGWDEVADLHTTALASANPYDVVSSDRHTVKPWFQGKIPFSFNIPEMAGTGYTLLGGRLVYLHQRPAAQLIVGYGLHRITVLVSRQDAGERAVSDGGLHNSFHTAMWQAGELRFRLIGDADDAVIQRLAGLFRQANP
jgi:anti-sigma factor RsiW